MSIENMENKDRPLFRNKTWPLVLSFVLFVFMELLVGTSDNLFSSLLRLIVVSIFVFCIFRGMSERSFLNPYFMFSITPFSLLLYTEEFSPYYLDKLEPATWGIAIINMIAFLFALSRTTGKTRIRFGQKYPCGRAMGTREVILSSKRIVRHSIALCFLGALPALGSIVGFSMPFRYLIKYALYIGIAFAFKSKNKMAIIISIIFSFINFVDDFNKTELLFLVITLAACFEAYYIQSTKDRVRFISLAVIGGLFMLVVAFPLKAYSRDGGDFFAFFRNSAEISASTFSWVDSRINFNGPYFLQMPYMYLIQAWNNVQYVMHTQPEHTFGLWAIKPFLNYIQLDGFFADLYTLIPASNFNTFTYITVLYKDFGYLGSALESAMLGYFVKSIYMGYRRNGSAFNVASYALTAMATLEMFFSNHFFGLSYPFTIVIFGMIYKKVFKLRDY